MNLFQRLLPIVTLIAVLGLIGYEYAQYHEEQKKLQAFVNKGGRFTAADGQALCERIAALERVQGVLSLPCYYDPREMK